VIGLWLAAVLGVGAALGAEPPEGWARGLALGQVSLETTGSALPGDYLLPLLRSTPGEPYQPWQVRTDLELLVRLGLFEAVEAHVEPGVTSGPDGEPVVVVQLVYRVQPAPVVHGVRLDGVRGLAPPVVRGAVDTPAGERWFDSVDRPDLEQRVERLYVGSGFPDARVTARAEPRDLGGVDLFLTVVEGEPQRLYDVSLVGIEDPALARRARVVLRRAGLDARTPPRRVSPGTSLQARLALEEELRRRGWTAARVTVFTDDQVRASVIVELGDHVDLRLEGWGVSRVTVLPWRRAVLSRQVDLSSRSRLSEWEVEEMADQLVTSLQRRGYRDARVDLSVEIVADGERMLVVRGRTGPRVRVPVDGIRFHGNQALDSATLRSAMAQAAPASLGRTSLLRRAQITDEDLEEALTAVRDLYRSRGYLQATVTPAAGPVDDRRRTRLVSVDVAIVEGAQAVLTDLVVEGGDPDLVLGFQERVDALVDQELSPLALQALATDLASAHRGAGYIAADARAQLRLSADGSQASVAIALEEGARVYVRSVAVRGVRRTRPGRVEREIAVAVGDPATPGSLGQTRSSLYELDLFDFVDARWAGDDPGIRDLVVDVEEKPRLSLEAGAGLATDVGLRAFTRGTVRHLWGLGHRVSGTAQVGFGYDGEGWIPELTTPDWRAALRYEAPNLPRTGQLVFVDALLNDRRQEPTWRVSRTGVAVGVALLRQDQLQLVVDTRLQARWLEDVDTGALVVGDPWQDVTTWRPQGGFGVSGVWDGRDDVLNPERGGRLGLDLELIEPWTTGWFGLRLEGSARWILPVGPNRLHLRLRGGVGWVPGTATTLGVEDRFTLGGASTMRGYPVDSVGPKNRVAPSDLPWPDGLEPLAAEAATDRWVPTGGDAYALATMEWWIPFPALGLARWVDASVVLFADVGNVWFLDPGVVVTSLTEDPEPLLRYGAGVGLRYATPVGPIQLDLGVNPVYLQQTWSEVRGEVPWRLHFSLGAI
jgi:outer membrane protein assembly factor BamA